jgi:hypothetical protein
MVGTKLQILMLEFLRCEHHSAYSQNLANILSTISTRKASVGERPSTDCATEDTGIWSVASCLPILAKRIMTIYVTSDK